MNIDYDSEFFNIELEHTGRAYARIKPILNRIKSPVKVPWWRYVLGTIIGLGFCLGCMLVFAVVGRGLGICFI